MDTSGQYLGVEHQGHPDPCVKSWLSSHGYFSKKGSEPSWSIERPRELYGDGSREILRLNNS